MDAYKIKDMDEASIRRLDPITKVKFVDGYQELNRNELILNNRLWRLLDKLPIELPLKTKYSLKTYYKDDTYTGDCMRNVFSAILKDAIEQHYAKINDRTGIDLLWEEMYLIFQDIYNNIVLDNPKYMTSLTILDFLEIQRDPRIIEAIRAVDALKWQSSRITNSDVDAAVTHAMDVGDKVLHDRKYNHNRFAVGYRNGSFRKNQALQSVVSRGLLPTLDKTLYVKPIASSYTLGNYNIADMFMESRAAAKALAQSHDTIKETEYLSRKLQLVCCRVERVINGDCGSTDYLELEVTPKGVGANGKPTIDMFPLVKGLWFLNEDTGELEAVTDDRKDIIGKKLKFRVPHKCKCKDPRVVCTKCMGLLSFNLPLHANIGHMAVTYITSRLSQNSLSTKHLMLSAVTIEALFNADTALDFETKKDNHSDIFLKKRVADVAGGTVAANLVGANRYLEIDPRNAMVFPELKTVKNVGAFDPKRESRIENCWIKHTVEQNGEEVEIAKYEVDIRKDKARPHFSLLFLDYVKKNGYTVDPITGNYVVNLNNWKANIPIFNIPDVESSIMALATSISKILGGVEHKDTSGMNINDMDTLLMRLHNEINGNNLDINLAYLSVIAYGFSAYDIDNNDYRLGRHSPKCQVAKLDKILANGSTGPMYAYEEHNKNMTNPLIYDEDREPANHIMDFIIFPNEVVRAYKKNPIRMHVDDYKTDEELNY